MNANPEQATVLLREIEEAKLLAARHSENSGTLHIGWGFAMFLGLAGFDFFRQFYSMLWDHQTANALGPYSAAVFMVTVTICAALWTRYYISGQPIRPLKLDNLKLLVGWGGYHTCVFALGSLPFFFNMPLLPCWFTLIGLLGAGPLIILGWRMRKRARTYDW